MARALHVAAAAVVSMALAACTPNETAGRSPSAAVTPTTTPPVSPSSGPTLEPAPPLDSSPGVPTPRGSATFDAVSAMADVRLLAGRIGPRLATGPAYRRAGRMVYRRLDALGYDVRREWFPVPAGDSWGVPVQEGQSFNVIAEPPGFDPTAAHVVLGAHLDTVAAAPGAEDNASGVSVMLEVARLATGRQTRWPVLLVAFGAEEPRGPGDRMHHFGSQHHVRELPHRRRRAIQAMISIDRVGVGRSVPVCTGPVSPPRVQRELLRTAARIGVPAHRCDSTASDHWSFEKVGVVVARMGGTSFAGYHSPGDLPGVVDRTQLGRTGRLAWAWLQP